MENGKECWQITCVDYLYGSIKNVEVFFSKDHVVSIKQYGKGDMPYLYIHMPELYITNEPDAYDIIRYQQFVETSIWAVEIGHIDINIEVSCLFSINFYHPEYCSRM